MHANSGAASCAVNLTIDDIEAILRLVQSDLEVDVTGASETVEQAGAPLDIKDAARGGA